MSFPLRLRLLCLAVTPLLLHPAPGHAAPPAVAAAGQRIAVTTSGQGPDVILIPGLASSAHVWDATVAHLAPTHRVHVVQVAGFAGAPAGPNASGPVLEPLVAALHDYIAAHRLTAPAVIGHSLGGLLAMKLALEHPADVGRLMVVDALPFYGLLAGPQATVASITPMAEGLRARIAGETQEAYAAGAPASVRRLVKSTGPQAEAVTRAAAASDHSVVAQAMYEDFVTDLRPDLPRIGQPVTMLYPWDSTSGFPQPAVDQLYTSAFASLKQAQLHRIDDSFHFILVDQPAAFETAVDTFLKD